MTELLRRPCPLCGRMAGADDRPPAEIGGLVFQSITCDRSPSSPLDHPFDVRWLEATVPEPTDVQLFQDRFVYVRGPLPAGSPIARAFGDADPIRAWVEHHETDEGFRILIRL